MPCNGNYLNPNERESQSKLVAELLVYLESKDSSYWLTDRTRKAAEAYYGDVEKLDAMVSTLCKCISGMTPEVRDKLVYNGYNPTSRKLADWWDHHQEADRVRLLEEKEVKKQERIKEEALEKLSLEEREALGI